ncbi:hypothetical protein BDR07DRAFT_1488694 [Suillus spraguei]|nr:hypothetical protein BDR07DRAFT_1488694 [Suillus spraguei]
MPTFNQAATNLKEKFKQQRGAEKTGAVFEKAYHSIIEIKCTSGFTWSDENGAGITDRKDDVWARFTKSHPHAKPYMSKGFEHFNIIKQLMPNQTKNSHMYWPTAVSTPIPPATESAAPPPVAPPPAAPPSSVDPDSLAPPFPSTFLATSSGGSTTDSAWTSISRSKCKFSALSPSAESVAGSQKRSRPPSATLLAQQEGTETMNLVEVVHEMQKSLTLAPLPLVLTQPGTHVGNAISQLNKCTNITSKECLAIANFLAEHENQAIIFYLLDEATRLEWLEEKRLLCGSAPQQAPADSQDHMVV